MPNKDWYWDRFETNVLQGELDLSQGQTSALAETKVKGRQDYTDKQRSQYETRFIDQLYGTEQRAWDTEVRPDGPTQGAYSTDSWQANPAAMHHAAGFGSKNATWGLDLVRDWTGKEHLEIGSDEHFKWQTQGKVDWAHYYNDNAYQKAYKEYKKEVLNNRSDPNLRKFLTKRQGQGRGGLVVQGEMDKARVDFISWAQDYQSAAEDNKNQLRDTWDNKYVDQFDPETAQPYSPTYLDVPDLWGDANITPTLTPKKVGPPAGLPTLGDMQRTQVTVPTGLKNWGAVSSAPQAKFQAGGQAGAEAGGQAGAKAGGGGGES